MSELADPPPLTLTLDPGECDALREVMADAIPTLHDVLDAEARSVLRTLAARLSAAAGGDESPLALSLSARERGALADAIDAWMASCNERRGEPGARERALRRYRAGGVALRL